MKRALFIGMVATVLCSSMFGMQKTTETLKGKSDKAHPSAPAQLAPKPSLKTEAPLQKYVKGECHNLLCTLCCCGCLCTVGSYVIKHALKSLDGNQ